MRKLLSITILPILLMLSIGFSGWSFGSNLIPNPDFDNDLSNWTADAEWLNDSGNGVANLTNDYLMLDPFGGYGVVDIGYYYWSFKWQTPNISGAIQANIDSANDIILNTTMVCIYGEGQCPTFPSFLDFDSTHITDLGGGWYKFETIMNISEEGGDLDCYVESFGNAWEYGTPEKILLDECKVQLLTYTPDPVAPCQGWECNTFGKMMIQTILALIPLFVVVGIILITKPESIMILAMELMIAGIMSVVMMSLI